MGYTRFYFIKSWLYSGNLTKWVKRAQINQIDNGQSEQDKLRIKQLEREVRELKRANEIIRMAAAFLTLYTILCKCRLLQMNGFTRSSNSIINQFIANFQF